MAQKFESRVLEVIAQATGQPVGPCSPSWLQKLSEEVCGTHWDLVCRIYYALTGNDLPAILNTEEWAQKRQRRTIDGVLDPATQHPRLIEVDETQHFNIYRKQTLALYPSNQPLAFDLSAWMSRSDDKPKQGSGGWAKPCPPLFPDHGGRHLQRAFRDALADLFPEHNNFLPTLRIGYFEVEGWIFRETAAEQMKPLLAEKMGKYQ